MRRLPINRSCRITEEKHVGELNADPRGTFTLDSADSCYLCGPLCCMFGLNWLGGGGIITPAGTQQVNRTWSRNHFSYLCSTFYIDFSVVATQGFVPAGGAVNP